MKVVKGLNEYGGNLISSEADYQDVNVSFVGTGNKLILVGNQDLKKLNINFPSDDGVCIVGHGGNFSGRIRVGYKCLVLIGEGVTCTMPLILFTAEETVFASENQIRTEDSHAIYDTLTGERLNHSRDILIGRHVWVADRAIILSGSQVGCGSTVGIASVVKGRLPNNTVSVGAPAGVIKRNAVWERDNIAFSQPWIRNSVFDEGVCRSEELYRETDDERSVVSIGKLAYNLLKNNEQYFDVARLEKLVRP